MHFFLYEWCSGGGLVHEPGALPTSLVREGVTMAGALAADLKRIPGARVTALGSVRQDAHIVLGPCQAGRL
jgi:hypothetical protein